MIFKGMGVLYYLAINVIVVVAFAAIIFRPTKKAQTKDPIIAPRSFMSQKNISTLNVHLCKMSYLTNRIDVLCLEGKASSDEMVMVLAEHKHILNKIKKILDHE